MCCLHAENHADGTAHTGTPGIGSDEVPEQQVVDRIRAGNFHAGRVVEADDVGCIRCTPTNGVVPTVDDDADSVAEAGTL